MRRRTPGGVYLFLLKNSPELQADHKRLIFSEETKKNQKDQKLMQAIKRDRKVEELKKTLKNENDLTVLSTRSEMHLKAESHTNRTYGSADLDFLTVNHCIFVFQYSIESTTVTRYWWQSRE